MAFNKKFGIREICDVVFKAKTDTIIGATTFKKGQPVLYIDTATASTLEQATTSVYARGGKGNTKLVSWEGEKELTFTVTDALLSPISLSILSGAGLFQTENTDTSVHVHMTSYASVARNGSTSTAIIDLSSALNTGEKIDGTAPVFISTTAEDGSLNGDLLTGYAVESAGQSLTKSDGADIGKSVFVDFYITKTSADVPEIQIDASSFGGNFYVEASTLFRGEDGKDYPAEITIPNVKIQSNFTFSMAATGDPSTFDFTMDAMPDYTMFDNTHKVMCVIQVVNDTATGASTNDTVMGHNKVVIDEDTNDSINNTKDTDYESSQDKE